MKEGLLQPKRAGFFLYLLDQSRALLQKHSDLWITRKLDPIKELCSKESAKIGLLFLGKQNKEKQKHKNSSKKGVVR